MKHATRARGLGVLAASLTLAGCYTWESADNRDTGSEAPVASLPVVGAELKLGRDDEAVRQEIRNQMHQKTRVFRSLGRILTWQPPKESMGLTEDLVASFEAGSALAKERTAIAVEQVISAEATSFTKQRNHLAEAGDEAESLKVLFAVGDSKNPEGWELIGLKGEERALRNREQSLAYRADRAQRALDAYRATVLADYERRLAEARKLMGRDWGKPHASEGEGPPPPEEPNRGG